MKFSIYLNRRVFVMSTASFRKIQLKPMELCSKQSWLQASTERVVGHCEGVVYRTTPGRPTDIGLQLGKACFLVAGKGRGACFYFLCFFTFIPVFLSSLSLSFISSTISSISFLPFSGRRHKMTHNGWRVVKPSQNQSIKNLKQSKDVTLHIGLCRFSNFCRNR